MSLEIGNGEAVASHKTPRPRWGRFARLELPDRHTLSLVRFPFCAKWPPFQDLPFQALGTVARGAGAGRPVARVNAKEKKRLGNVACCAWTGFVSGNRIHWTWLASLPFRQLPTFSLVLEPAWG